MLVILSDDFRLDFNRSDVVCLHPADDLAYVVLSGFQDRDEGSVAGWTIRSE
jgi:hypothetical protein